MTDLELFEALMRKSSLCEHSEISITEQGYFVVTLRDGMNCIDILFDKEGNIQ